MTVKKVLKGIAIGISALFILAVCFLGYMRWSMQSGLDKWCTTAQQHHPHPGDDVKALLEYVQSDTHSLRKRNLVVWALGQARDNRALPVLEGYYTGEKCDHDRTLCQGELAKAIKLCKEGALKIPFIRTPKVSPQQ
jgi:hypothetical protein